MSFPLLAKSKNPNEAAEAQDSRVFYLLIAKPFCELVWETSGVDTAKGYAPSLFFLSFAANKDT
jgi:hypothetical protein